MEKYKCNLCFRNFANGRALGGHMRSHVKNQHVPPKTKIQYQFQEEELEEEDEEKNDRQLSEEMESLPSSSSEEEEDEDEVEEDEEEIEIGIRNGGGGLIMCKGKRFGEKQQGKRNYLVDPEFSSQLDATAGSVVLQDRESETESSICRRSKRIRKSKISDTRGSFSGYDNITESPPPPQNLFDKQGKSPIGSPLVEHEPVSSISDTTPEEHVAYCLMMLSRDKWNEQEDEEESELQEKGKYRDRGVCGGGGAINKVSKTRNRGKFKCETCYKVFRSYQALGGHRASHKRTKVKSNSAAQEESAAMANACSVDVVVEEKKIHQCPVCYRVFSSGQALGGHKRSHFLGGTTAAAAAAAANIISIQSKPFSRFGENLIDLNLPAPMDDDDEISQIELSAVSDAEFDNPINRR